MHSLYSIIVGLLVFGVIVFIHELGHYLAARWCKIRVDVFSIGFGPALCKWRDRVGTQWQLSAFPLGGYVKLHGFEADATQENPEGDEQAFHRKPVWARALVTVMGPVFNIVLTILLFIVIFSLYGRPEVKPEISMIAPQSPAEQAGLQKGDNFVKFDGKKILGAADLQSLIFSHPGQKVTLSVKRQESTIDIPVTLGTQMQGDKKHGQLGVGFAVTQAHPMPFYKAIPASFISTGKLFSQIFESLWQIISGQRSPRQLAGTIGIIAMSGQAADSGTASLLFFVAMLSANLGLINLFPIPMLDGGHLVFYAAEAIRGKPVSLKVREIALQVGFFLVMALFLYTAFNDVTGLGWIKWLTTHL
ncbi:RIP metalloprotease RseP [Aristophania vespae]|uniref:Zinc metalloprotease n=1 Tax=Aristophania vespae TaxID=2697033 RepID=A0A6P1NCU6_9PROT|nr:RIP metalloprotease RseP [Aristophania vespae]QHI95338.1 RIP metalloprotease RseP [Aristophania vespae]UMM64602.1 Metalloprotease MmpA [Aristophania vespae]